MTDTTKSRAPMLRRTELADAKDATRRDLYTQDFQLSEKDIKLRELAVRYHQEAEAFDRTVCTGPVINGGIQPATPRELAIINMNASKIMRILEDEARMLGATLTELRRAVAKVQFHQAPKPEAPRLVDIGTGDAWA